MQRHSEDQNVGELGGSGGERRRARVGFTDHVEVQVGDSYSLPKKTFLRPLLRPSRLAGVGVKAEGAVKCGEPLAVGQKSGPGEAAVGGTSWPGWYPLATRKPPQSCSSEASWILESLPSAQEARSFGTPTFMAMQGVPLTGGSPIRKSREGAEIQ